MLNPGNSNQIKQTTGKNNRWLFIVLLFVCITLIMSGRWLLTSPSGLQWLLSAVSRVSANSIVFEGIQGSLSSMQINLIRFTSSDLHLTLQGTELDWQPDKLLSGKLLINVLSAQDVEVRSFPSSTSTSASLPESLRLPLSMRIDKLSVVALRVWTKESDIPDFSATELSVRLESDGQRHYLSDLFVNFEDGTLKASAQINGDRPFDLSAQANLISALDSTGIESSKIDLHTDITGNLEQVNLKINGSGAGVNADADMQLLPYDLFPVSVLRLSIAGFNPNIFLSQAPDADLTLHAELHKNTGGQLVGKIAVKNKAVASLDRGGLPLLEIYSQAILSTESLELNDLLIRFVDNGIVSGDFSWQMKESSGSVDLAVKQLNPCSLDARLRSAHINGSIKLIGDTKTQRGVLTLKDNTFNLDAKILHSADVVMLEELYLSRDQSLLTGKGKLDLNNLQRFEFKGGVRHFNFSDFLQSPSSDLNATIKLTGNLMPRISGLVDFKIENSKLAKQPVAGNGQIAFNDLKQIKGMLELSVGSNHVRALGGFGRPGESMQLDIVAPVLSQIGFDLNGALNARVRLSGSLVSPKIGFEINGKNLSLPGKHQLTSLIASGNLDDRVIVVKIEADDYRTENETHLQYLNIDVMGTRSAHTLVASARINDDFAIELDAAGELANLKQTDSALRWIGKISQFSATGPLPFRLLMPTSLELSPEHVSLGASKFALAGGEAHIKMAQWTPEKWFSQGDFTGIALNAKNDSTKKQKALHLGGNWHITSAMHLTSSLQIIREKGDWVLPGETPLSLGLQVLQLSANATNGELSGELFLEGERIGKTKASITLPLAQSNAGWTITPDAALNGQITMNVDDIAWIGNILDDTISSSGQFSLQAGIGGTFGKPEIQGRISGENLALALLDQGVRLEQGKLAADFDQSSLRIDKLNFAAPIESPPRDRLLSRLKLTKETGNLSISGVIGLSGNDSNMKIELDHLPLARQSNYWIIVSGNGHARFNKKMLAIGGEMIADAGLLAEPPTGRPQLADDILIGEEPQSTPDKSLLNLNFTLDLGKQFYIRASGLEGRLAGQLRLQNDAKRGLSAKGSIATHKAIFEAYGQRLKVKRGIVNFYGPLDNPGLNVLAVREKLPVEAGIEVIGTVRRPKIRLVSTPNVPDSEKLSWIVLGRPPHAGGVDTSLLLTAASSILSGQPGGGITDQISQALGVDEISVRQTGNGNPLTHQIGTIGKRLSSRAYISYERSLTAATVGVTKLTYNLTPSISIVTQAGVDSAIDIFYTFQFD